MFQTSMGLSGSSWLLWMQGCGDLEWLERHNIITWRVFQPCRQFLLPLEHHLTLFYLRLQMNTNSDKYKFLSVGMPISQAPTCLIPTCLIPTLMLFSLVRWKGLCTKLDQETAFPDHWRSWNQFWCVYMSVVLVMLLAGLGNVTRHFYGIWAFICLRDIGNTRHSFMENQTVVKIKNPATTAKLLNHSNNKF